MTLLRSTNSRPHLRTLLDRCGRKAGICAVALIVATGAFAQTSGSAPPDQKPDDQNAPQHFDSGKKPTDQTLSERLDRSDGVIKPPSHVDREMLQAPPPSADSEMVIRPPRDERPRVPK